MLGRVEHVLTHRKLTIDVYAMENVAGRARTHLKPVHLGELGGLGVATLTRKILALATTLSEPAERSRARERRAK